jgi:hypothetical protein
MRPVDHDSHKWRYSDSSYYDFVCEKCGIPEGTQKAGEPCPNEDKVQIPKETT